MRGHRKLIAFALSLVAGVILALTGRLSTEAAALIAGLMTAYGTTNALSKKGVKP